MSHGDQIDFFTCKSCFSSRLRRLDRYCRECRTETNPDWFSKDCVPVEESNHGDILLNEMAATRNVQRLSSDKAITEDKR